MSLVTWFKLFCRCIQNWLVFWYFNLWVAEWDRGACFPPVSIHSFAEVLDNAVRKDENSHGINLAKVECKLSQYADDTTMILDRSKLSFSRTLYLLDTFAISSGGLKMIEVQSFNESLKNKWIIYLNSFIRIDYGVKDVRDLLGSSNYNFVTYTAFITSVCSYQNGKNVPPVKTSLPWKKRCRKKSHLATKIIRSFSKERLHRQWKARKSGFLKIFFQMYKWTGKKKLSATISV